MDDSTTKIMTFFERMLRGAQARRRYEPNAANRRLIEAQIDCWAQAIQHVRQYAAELPKTLSNEQLTYLQKWWELNAEHYPAQSEPPQDVVERVAIAICPWAGNIEAEISPAFVWKELSEEKKGAYRRQARAALAALPYGAAVSAPAIALQELRDKFKQWGGRAVGYDPKAEVINIDLALNFLYPYFHRPLKRETEQPAQEERVEVPSASASGDTLNCCRVAFEASFDGTYDAENFATYREPMYHVPPDRNLIEPHRINLSLNGDWIAFQKGYRTAQSSETPVVSVDAHVEFWKAEYKSLARAGVERLAELGYHCDPAERMIEAAEYREKKLLDRPNQNRESGKRWSIVETAAGYEVHSQTEELRFPVTTYPNKREAASRILQLLGVGPVAPQSHPERVEITRVDDGK